ncbi:MAG: CatB-related O-acetyltransferase [Shinella sp.]|nr:CatB-related O-acetyltransferase [Shinella sp.]
MAPFRKLRTRLGLRKERKLPKGVSVGRYTYGVKPEIFHGSSFDLDVRFGAFCSVAEEVIFMQMADHDLTPVSSFPLGRRLFGSPKSNVVSKGPIIVGNDVWICRRAMIMSGVTIGDGAIIGAGAVVAKDVPPYAIVVGNPGRVVKYRFTEDEIELLLRLKWWEWPEEKLSEHKELLMAPSGEFLSFFSRK